MKARDSFFSDLNQLISDQDGEACGPGDLDDLLRPVETLVTCWGL